MANINYSKPFKVRIIEDCRERRLDSHYGVCLGLYKYPNIWEKSRIETDGNPLILTKSGDYIWGCECWWDPHPEKHKDTDLDLMQKILQIHKEKLRKEFGIDFDPSTN